MRSSLVLLLGAMLFATPASAQIPCIKTHKLGNDIVDADSGNSGRIRYGIKLTKLPEGAVTRYRADGTLALTDVTTKKRVAIKWSAVGDTEPLAQASVLVAVASTVLQGGSSAPGIDLTSVKMTGATDFPVVAAERTLALIASSQGFSGGTDSIAAIGRTAGALGLTLPPLLP